MTVAPVPGNGPFLFQARRTGLSVIKLQLNCHDKGTQREPSERPGERTPNRAGKEALKQLLTEFPDYD